MNDEDWRLVIDFPNYYVSTYGRIYSVRQDKIMKLQVNKYTKNVSILFRDEDFKDHRKMVSKLVYETFVDSVPTGYIIIHKDGDRSNCNINNLELVSRHDYMQKVGKNKKVEKSNSNSSYHKGIKVREVSTDKIFDSIYQASKYFNTSYQVLTMALRDHDPCVKYIKDENGNKVARFFTKCK